MTLITPNNFGLHACGGHFTKAAEAGASIVRLIVQWHEVHRPHTGEWLWSALDREILSAQRAGLDVVLTIRPVSRRAVDVDYTSLPRDWTFYSGMPKQMSQWLEFVRRITERYDKDRQGDASQLLRAVNYWQIDNEVQWQWQGTIQQYEDLFNLTAKAIRTANAKAKVISGAITHLATITLSRLQHFSHDIIDIHAYDDDPQQFKEAVLRLKASDQDAEIWTLENAGPMTDYSEERHCEHIVQRHKVAFEAGVSKFFWSSLKPTGGWDDRYRRLALLDAEGHPRKAYWAYKEMIDAWGTT